MKLAVNPLWSSYTKSLFDSFCRRPRGSLYITGPAKSGRTTALEYLVDQIMTGQNNPNPIEQLIGATQNFDPKDADPKAFKVEPVQNLVQRLSLSPPDPDKPYLVVIDDFDQLGFGAQNVLLKHLEEPGRQTSFLISASEAPGKVLPTIVSRCQPIQLRRPTRPEVLAWAKSSWPQISPQAIEGAYIKADGWPAAVYELLDHPEDSLIDRQIKQAKEFLQADDGPAGRLAAIQKLPGNDDRQKLVDLIAGLRRISRGALASQARQNQAGGAQSWQKRVVEFDRLGKLLDAGCSPPAVGLALSLFDQPRR